METLSSTSNTYFKILGDDFLAESYCSSNPMAHTHVHSVYEFYFCPIAISQKCIICGNEYTYAHPAVILTKPYTIHSMAVTTPMPRDKYWYVFSFSEGTAEKSGIDQILKEIARDHLGILFSLSQEQADYLDGILHYMFHPDYPLPQEDALSLFSFFLHRLHFFSNQSPYIGVGSASNSVQQVMHYICQNFHAAISTNALAQMFSVSRSKLDRDFKAAIGITPKDFTELCRLHCAKKLLVTKKDTPVSQIAQLCGFPSENYFYRFFRQHTGVTPTQYKCAVAKDSHI